MFTVELLSMKSDDKIEAELTAILGPPKYILIRQYQRMMSIDIGFQPSEIA